MKNNIELGKIESALGSVKGLHRAAEFVQAAAKANAPVFDGQLRNNIYVDYEDKSDGHYAYVYTPIQHAIYVEFGTGPKGASSHAGISPEITPTYTLHPWWIHESQLSPKAKAVYKWRTIQTPDGVFYQSYGQAAQPFMYPALADNEATVRQLIADNFISGVSK